MHVPEKSIETYKTTDPWSKFKTFVPIIIPEHTLTYLVDGEVYKTYSIEEDETIIPEPEPVRDGFAFSGWSEIPETMPDHDVTVTGTFIALPKCATPIIRYENGQLSFTCDTEDAEFLSDITDTDIAQRNIATISLTATYNISVYAKAPNHAVSDTAKATLCWIDVEPKTEGITNSIANVPAKAVLIQTAGGMINVQGCDDGEQVGVYSINGSQVGTAVSQNGAATVNTTLQSGSVAIIKVGEKSIKVVVK